MKESSPRKYIRDDEFIIQVGAKIRGLRIQKNISQEALAFDVGTSYSQVNRLELGKLNISISFLKKIAVVLRVDPKDLLP